MTQKVPKLTPYSTRYKEDCFQAWYAADRPTYAQAIMSALPEDEYGRKPVLDVIRRWRNDEGWDVRADKLDLQVRSRADERAVTAKVQMLEEHAARARMMQEKGAEYLENNDFDSSASAVQAIIRGAQLERESRGLSTALLKIAQLTDEDLLSETQKMVERLLKSGETIDVAEIEEDAESED